MSQRCFKKVNIVTSEEIKLRERFEAESRGKCSEVRGLQRKGIELTE